MEDRRGPSGVEWPSLNLVFRRRFSKLGIFLRFDERIVPANRGFQRRRRNWLKLVWVPDLGGQIRDRFSREEPAVRIDVRWFRIPALAYGGVRIEYRPDRTASVGLAILAKVAV